MLPIQKMIISINYRKGNKGIKYIVIHDTGNKDVGANAKANRNYFANHPEAEASSNYCVDDSNIIQCVEDWNTSWHCGDGHRAFGIENENSVSIEICVNKDGDYNKACCNAIELTKYLMKKHGIPTTRVVRHYDASRKSCPKSMEANNWAKWYEFKSKLEENCHCKENIESNKDLTATVINASRLNVRDGESTDYDVIGAVFENEKVICKNIVGHWLYIQYDTCHGKKEGWVSGNYLCKNFRTGIVTASRLNVRSGSSINCNRIGSLWDGESVIIKGQSNNWYNVIYNTSHGAKEGWVSANYIN